MLKSPLVTLLFLLFAGVVAAQPVAKSIISESSKEIPVYDFGNFSKILQVADDKIYIVNFWATWCGPCIKELPHFEALPAQIGGRQIKVILVSLDMLKEAKTKLIPFVTRKKLKSEVILLHETDADAWISKVDANWSGALPATLILSKNNRAFYEQSFTSETLNEALNLFINSN